MTLHHHPLAPAPHPDPQQQLRRALQSATPPAPSKLIGGSCGALPVLLGLALGVALVTHPRIRRQISAIPGLLYRKERSTSPVHSDSESSTSETAYGRRHPEAAILSGVLQQPEQPLEQHSEDTKSSKPAGRERVMAQADGGGDADLDGPPGIPGESTRDEPMPDAEDLLETPQQLVFHEPGIPSGGPTHRYETRSRTRQEAALEEIGSRSTPLFSKLQAATRKWPARASSSRLEDAKDIQDLKKDAVDAGDHGEEADEVQDIDEDTVEGPGIRNTTRPRSSRRHFTSKRRSARIKALDSSQPSRASSRKKPPRKAKVPPTLMTKKWPRRSARLAKPLTEFHKFPELPPELQIIVWEHAITPRLVYIRNRSAPNFTNIVQNRRPAWFMACGISCKDVAEKQYQKMFALWKPDDRGPVQPVNPNVDIVVLEPCGSGCRAHYCTRHQFTDQDRAAVRFLAVQTESPWLWPTAKPCWETISQSWPNVETLYLLRQALTGDKYEDFVLFRIGEGTRERSLRQRFDDWKKGDGKDKTMTTLEFVAAEPKQDTPGQEQQLFGRKTGLPEDIILG